jgi:hypothetical protein
MPDGKFFSSHHGSPRRGNNSECALEDRRIGITVSSDKLRLASQISSAITKYKIV